MSVGTKGLRVGAGPRGIYSTVGIPGTGLSSTTYLGKNTRSKMTYSHNESPELIPIPQNELQNASSSLGCLVFVIGLILLFFIPWLGIAVIISSIVLSVKNKDTKIIALYKKANDFARQGNYHMAAQQIEEILKLKPTLNMPKFHLATLYAEMENCQEAIRWYEEYLKNNENEIAKFNLALCYSEVGQKEKAFDILQSLSPEAKKELRYINALGSLLLDMGTPDLALEVLEAGPVRKQTMTDEIMLFRYLLGLTYKQLGERKKAITQLQKVYVNNKNYKDVEKLLNELNALKDKQGNNPDE